MIPLQLTNLFITLIRPIVAMSGILWLSSCCGCGSKPMRTSKTEQAEKLLAVAEDKSLDLQTRANAVNELGDLKEKWTTKRLIALLGDEYNVLTYQTIGALGKIGDPAALPALLSLQENPKGVMVPGPFPSILENAIQNCQTKQVE